MDQRCRPPGARAALLAAVGLFLLGCTKPRPAPTGQLDRNQQNRTAVDAGASAGAMPFALVAIAEVSRLHRLLDGSVLAASGGVLYALDREGGVESLDRVFFAMQDVLGDLGSVGGTWPGMLLVETYRLGAGDGITASFLLRGDHRRVTVERRLAGAYLLPPALWKGGALLTVRAEGHSSTFGAALDRAARFELIGPSKEVAPRFPKDALFDDAFVAYPSGFVFALGGRRARPVVEDDASEYEQEHGYMIDGAIIWQTDGVSASLHPVQLPDTTARDRLRGGRLAMGRSAPETLVFGVLESWRQRQSTDQPYLARFGPSGWRRVPIDTPILRVDTGRDGTTWAVCGSDGYGSTDESFLARVTLPADGGVQLAPTMLLPNPAWRSLGELAATSLQGCTKLRPRELAVIDQNDRWLTAQCLRGPDSGSTVLLHTQVQKTLLPLKTFDRSPAGGR